MNVELATPTDVDLPPLVNLPGAALAAGFLLAPRHLLQSHHKRHGSAFRLDMPLFGPGVVIADPGMARQLFTAGDKVINVQPNLGRVLGTGSIFSLEGNEHRQRRKLLTPPLHGKRIKRYEEIVAEEVERETADWQVGVRFASLEPMMRITLNVILRAVFGADGHHLDSLRRIMPPLVVAGSRSATMPPLPRILRSIDPTHKMIARRAEYQRVVMGLIRQSRDDARLDERDDILALMLQSTYEDGSRMSDDDIADELLTLLAAGHETTATTLAWALERIQRHPDLLDQLVAEVDEGGDSLRHATILETQRSRPVIDFAARHVVAESLELGPWRIPRGYNVLVSIGLLHDDSEQFSDPARFDPTRFVDSTPSAAWLPFGGGTRRCIGAAFATMEMDVTLRTLLRDFILETTDARGEAWHNRGVASAPRRGGRITVYRR